MRAVACLASVAQAPAPERRQPERNYSMSDSDVLPVVVSCQDRYEKESGTVIYSKRPDSLSGVAIRLLSFLRHAHAPRPCCSVSTVSIIRGPAVMCHNRRRIAGVKNVPLQSDFKSHHVRDELY